MPQAVTLPRNLVNKILTHAQHSPEDEVCGLIGAQSGHAVDIYPVKNVAEDTHTLFQMDPKQQIDAMRQMREQGHELFAIYHSHPHAPAAPSATDMEQAGYPDALYLIISLNTTGVLEMRGFHLEGGQASEVELELHEAD
jgi:proteasome lid subunit RPN8/RPN11